MQNRPSIENIFRLQKQFMGTTTMGSWNIWVSLGNYIDFQGGRNNLHKHSFYEACLVLEGEGQFYHGDRYYPLRAGDLFIATPGVDHEIISSYTIHLKIQFVSFSFQKIEKIEEKIADETSLLFNRCIKFFLDHRPVHIHNCTHLEYYFKQLQNISKKSNYGEWYLQSEGAARSLIVNIIIESVKEEIKIVQSLVIDPRLKIALNFIEDNPFRRLTLNEIAGQSFTSVRTLRRLMKKYYGKTVVQKNLEIRIKASADYLISHPEKNVSEVSCIFGFENPSDFGREFKQVMKVSPGVFRKNKGTFFAELSGCPV